MTTVAIVYHTEYGNNEKMAEAVAAGAEEAGARVNLKRVADATPEDLVEADAVVWGGPSKYGLPSAPLKEFMDKTGQIWFQGKLIGKVGAAFTSTATSHGGKEHGLLAMITPFLHHGMVVVGLPNNVPGNDKKGSYYGASATIPVAEDDLVLGHALGRRVAEIAAKLKA